MKVAVVRPVPAEMVALFVMMIAVAILAGMVRVAFFRKSEGRIAYERRNRLFSAAERSFLGVLEQILGDNYRVIGKVRMADIIRPSGVLTPSERTSALNRIVSKHVDFAVCDPKTMQVVGVIELDDSSHAEGRQRRRDEFVDAALVSAGVPIVRIPVQSAYTPAQIRLRLSVLFHPA